MFNGMVFRIQTASDNQCKHSNKYTLQALGFDCSFALAKTINQTLIVMNRSEFEELEMQVQQSKLPLKLYLQQVGVSYSTYHYWRKKCTAEKDSLKQELAPISFKHPTAEPTLGEQVPQGVALLFPNGLRAHFGSGSEKLLMELLTHSLESSHV